MTSALLEGWNGARWSLLRAPSIGEPAVLSKVSCSSKSSCIFPAVAGADEGKLARDSYASVPAVFRLIRSTMLKNVYDDKDRADALLIASGLDYTNVRPPRLTNGPAAGAVRTSADGRGLSKSISRADVAAFLVSQLDDRTWLRQSPVIGN